jgi:hypothetical protein
MVRKKSVCVFYSLLFARSWKLFPCEQRLFTTHVTACMHGQTSLAKTLNKLLSKRRIRLVHGLKGLLRGVAANHVQGFIMGFQCLMGYIVQRQKHTSINVWDIYDICTFYYSSWILPFI